MSLFPYLIELLYRTKFIASFFKKLKLYKILNILLLPLFIIVWQIHACNHIKRNKVKPVKRVLITLELFLEIAVGGDVVARMLRHKDPTWCLNWKIWVTVSYLPDITFKSCNSGNKDVLYSLLSCMNIDDVVFLCHQCTI